MKKRLLLTFAAVLGAVSSTFAYEDGEYIYTNDGRYRVVGQNLLTNGDFSGGLNGWTTIDGQDLSSTNFTVAYDDEGRDGKPCIVLNTGENFTTNIVNSTNLVQSVLVQDGYDYIFTYKTKSYVGGVSSTMIYSRNGNYQNCIVNADGQIPQLGSNDTEAAKIVTDFCSWSNSPAGEWVEKAYYYHAEATEELPAERFLNVFFFNLQVGDRFADFGIYRVEQSYDDRIAKGYVDYLNYFANDEENFPGLKEELAEPIEALNDYINNPADHDAEYQESVDGLFDEIVEGVLNPYLDGVSADVSSYYTNFTFDNASTLSAGKGAPSGWTSSTGTGRWGCRDTEWGTFTPKYAIAEIGANYALPASQLSQSSNLPGGKYLYVVKAAANRYYQNGSGSSSNYYIIDNLTQVDGMKYFVNDETVDMENVPVFRGSMYAHVFNVAEDGLQTIGFSYPETPKCDGIPPTVTSGGGLVRFDNMQIRILGKTQEEIEAYFLKETLATSRNALKVMIDSANVVVAKDMYIFGKDVLRDSINVSQNIYDNLTLSTQTNIDAVNAQMTYMRDAIRAHYTLNAEYVKLGEDIADCKVVISDETLTKGRDAFQAVINTADNYYTSLNVNSERDSLTLVTHDENLIAAKATFGLANASYSTPADIPMVNGSFSTKNSTGWVVDGVTGNGAWKFQSNSDFTDGYCAYYNRGYTAKDAKFVYQDVPVEANGVYIFSAEIICRNYSMGASEEASTEMYIFAEQDSTEVYTQIGEGVTVSAGQDYPGGVKQFTQRLTVDDVNALSTPGYIRVGFAGTNNERTVYPNLMYIGSCHLYYYGSVADYETGITDTQVKTSATGDIYSINGVKVRSNGTLKGLEKGIYIMNGKKYVVK